MKVAFFTEVLLLIACGCMVGPTYHRPTIETPSAWRFADSNAKESVNAAFWEQFGDTMLDSLIAGALRSNEDIAIAAGRVEEFTGILQSTRSALFPQIGAGTNDGRGRFFNEGTFIGPVSSYALTLSGSWQLDLFGGLRRATQAARADLLSAREAQRGVLLTVVGAVAAGYMHLAALEEELAITQRTASSRKETYGLFTSQFERGAISELDLRQAESEYEQANAAIPQLEKAIAQQENTLSVLLGRNPGFIPRGKGLQELALPAVPTGLPSNLLQNRPDIRQAEQELIAANARIGVAYASYFPSLSLTGLFGWASNELRNLVAKPNVIWNYAGSFDEQIFTGGERHGQVLSAKAVYRQALARYHLTIRNGFREVEDALIDQQKTREEIGALTAQTEALRKAAYFARLRYTNGYTSYIEVLDAERSLFDAEFSLAQARETLLDAFTNLYIALGGGWGGKAEQLLKGVEKNTK
jgi:multidrug efflux system outer membrane protein